MAILSTVNDAFNYLRARYQCDLFMTSGQVADALQMSVSHVDRLCRDGVLPAIRVGDRWKIQTQAVATIMINGLSI